MLQEMAWGCLESFMLKGGESLMYSGILYIDMEGREFTDKQQFIADNGLYEKMKRAVSSYKLVLIGNFRFNEAECTPTAITVSECPECLMMKLLGCEYRIMEVSITFEDDAKQTAEKPTDKPKKGKRG